MKARTYRAWTDNNAASYYLRQAEALLGISHPQTQHIKNVVRVEGAGCVLYVTEPSLWRTRTLLYDIKRGGHDSKG